MSIINETLKSGRRATERNGDELNQEWLLLRGFNELRSQRHLVDVVLVVEGRRLAPCHRAVLAASSSYFRAMFTHDVIEQKQSEIELKDLNFQCVSAIVDYMYTGKIELDNQNVQDLLTATSILQIVGLYGKCSRYMQARLTIHNAVEVYVFAKTICCTELQNDALSVTTRRFSDILATESFLNLRKDDLVDIISSDELGVEQEETVYEMVLAWLTHDIAFRASSINEVFSHIRFALLKDDYLKNCILQEKLIMEFPYIAAQVTAALYYKACNNIAKQTVKTEQSKENTSAKSTLQVCNQQLETQQYKQDFFAFSNSKQDEAPSESKHETSISLPFIKSLDDKKLFLECPYYEVQADPSKDVIRIPLEVLPRMGMLKSELLLFTNGRKTMVFDLGSRRYYSGCKDGKYQEMTPPCFSDEESTLEVDLNMPVMKSAEVYSTKSGTVYLIGGLEVDKSSVTPQLRSKVFIFDAETFSWKPRKALDDPRCMMGMGELDGNFVVTGGKTLASGNISSLVQMYDQEKDAWWDSTPLPIPVYGHQCASVEQKLFVMGGKTAQKEIQNSVYFLHAATHQWTISSSMNVPRFLAGTTVYRSRDSEKDSFEREVIYVVGGVGGDGILSSVEHYDPNTGDRWKFKEDFPGNRCAQTLISLNGGIYAVGGHVTERNDDGRYESIQKYDVFALEVSGDVTNKPCQWRQIVRHIKGIFGTSCACAGIRVNKNKLCTVFP